MPLFSAISTASLNASIWTASWRFDAILIVTAAPFGPTWKTFGPIASSTGRTRAKTSSSPPTITASLPCSSVITLPETGASSMCASSAATRAAIARELSGLAVDMST